MLNQVYTESDTTFDHVRDKVIAVVGYGIQGRAQALCLRDSELDVIVGSRSGGPSAEQAAEDGFKVMSAADAVREADVVNFLVADPAQPEVYTESIHSEPFSRRHPLVRPRLQRRVRPDPAPRRRQRWPVRSERPGISCERSTWRVRASTGRSPSSRT